MLDKKKEIAGRFIKTGYIKKKLKRLNQKIIKKLCKIWARDIQFYKAHSQIILPIMCFPSRK